MHPTRSSEGDSSDLGNLFQVQWPSYLVQQYISELVNTLYLLLVRDLKLSRHLDKGNPTINGMLVSPTEQI
jgi:hypothetical protein